MIALAGPVMTTLYPETAVVVGAVAGVWLLLARTWLLNRQTTTTDEAAGVQAMFDGEVFGMPVSIRPPSTLSTEDVFLIAGSDSAVKRTAEKESMLEGAGWYPIDASTRPTRAVAICQRVNVSYADRLLRTTARVWCWVLGVWGVVAITLASVSGLSFTTILLGMLLPLLPAALDAVLFIQGIRKAASSRGQMAAQITARLDADDVTPDDLLIWQGHILELRRETPEVPNFIYNLSRKRNEEAMIFSAQQLQRGQK